MNTAHALLYESLGQLSLGRLAGGLHSFIYCSSILKGRLELLLGFHVSKIADLGHQVVNVERRLLPLLHALHLQVIHAHRLYFKVRHVFTQDVLHLLALLGPHCNHLIGFLFSLGHHVHFGRAQLHLLMDPLPQLLLALVLLHLGTHSSLLFFHPGVIHLASVLDPAQMAFIEWSRDLSILLVLFCLGY